MAAAPLQGSSLPLDGGGFVVTVICPNAYSHQRLMQALLSIVPDAGEPPRQIDPVLGVPVPAPSHTGNSVIIRDPERDDDEGERDFTVCRVEGGCE
jgi:hypothetical protein